MKKLLAVIGLLALAALCSCSSNGNTAAAPLQDAGSLRASSESAAAIPGVFGQPVKMNNLQITVTNPVVGGDDSGGWLTVTVKVENLGTQEDPGFNPGILCAGGESGSGNSQADSTLKLMAGFPARSVDSGTLNLLTAGQKREGQPATPCQTPAVIELVPLITYDKGPTGIRIPIPDDLIVAMNTRH